MLVLLLPQAGFSLCRNQCMEQQWGAHNEMSHCHSALQTTATSAAADCCPARSGSVCVMELPANSQNEAANPPSIESELREILPAIQRNPSLTGAFSHFRSSVGDPPLIAPLRV
jgi:hypothetical protein